MTLERGANLHNRYRIIEILGQGGMGSIYRAIDENLGVEVAVKENLFTTEEFARQFRREAIILASLKNPNLPRVSDHFVIEGQGQYLVMDYIEGEDLRERMDNFQYIPEEQVIVVGVAICEAMSYMHSQRPPVLHRDIKPGNVRITPDGHIFLVDFGLAKIVQGGEQTATGARAMTPGYSPPEQYGAARTDQRSDVFSLGATLYAALTGAVPEDSLARTMEQLTLTPVRKRNPKVSRRLANTIEKALAVHPDDRFQTADEFKAALLSARRGTLRRISGQGTLPPVVLNEDDQIFDSSESIEVVAENQPPDATDPSALPLPSSSSLPKNSELIETGKPIQRRKKTRSRRKTGCLVIILVLVFSLILGYAFISRSDPSVFQDQLDKLLPQVFAFIDRPTPDLILQFSSTPSPSPEKATEVGVAVSETLTAETKPPTLTITPEPKPSATILPTETKTSRPTNPPTATPMGGGYGQIAFSSNRTGLPQIWVINVDGSGLRRITDTQQGACQPSWSPDGMQIAFISPCDTHREVHTGSSIFIIDEDGKNLTPLPIVGGGDYDPAWSPDGKSILLTSLREGGIPQLFVMDIEERSVELLSDSDERWGMQGSWSVDGRKIIFISTRNGPYQIWTMNADGSSPLRFSASSSKKNQYPDWSPDMKMIVFSQSETDGAIPRLFAARYPDGAINETRVYPFAGNIPMRNADYSQDGYWLALESWPDGVNHDIFIMTPNGAERTQITKDPGLDFDPAWRPILP